MLSCAGEEPVTTLLEAQVLARASGWSTTPSTTLVVKRAHAFPVHQAVAPKPARTLTAGGSLTGGRPRASKQAI
jgi:hypothetical protein